MRYPVGATGSQEEFERDWYIAQEFGNPTKYGFHDGVDINLRTGGNTDLGQELKAIAGGKVVYYHYASHPTYGFGRHLVLEIEGPWGKRWAHYAHCTADDFTREVKEVSEGQIIARIGNSGTPYAHVHFSILKVDPVSIGGIDAIPSTSSELHNWFEDPITFIKKWMNTSTPEPPTQEVNDQTKFDFGEPWGEMEMQAVRSKLNDQNREIVSLKGKIEAAQEILR